MARVRQKRVKNKTVLVSVIMPCLNEEESVGKCIEEAAEGVLTLKSLKTSKTQSGEIVVADNGSADKSVEEIIRASVSVREKYRGKILVRLIHERQRGYGAALLKGFSQTKGEVIVMGDSDGSYNFREIPKLVRPILDGGYDLVVGSRLSGQIEDDAMPFFHRRLGTPVLTALANRLFGLSLSDSQSGFRAISADAYRQLGMRMEGMEFASEMLARAGQANLNITEVPISYRKRLGSSKLLPMSDAWRHLRFLLLFSPGLFFSFPGMVLLILGTIGFILTAPAPFHIANTTLDVHTLSVSGMGLLLGVQLLFLSIFARVYGKYALGLTKDDFINFIIQKFQLEQGLRAGTLLFAGGLAILSWVTGRWILAGFPSLSEVRPVIVATVIMLLGAQIFFSSFFLSFLRGEGK